MITNSNDPTRAIAICFAVSALSSVALVVVYVAGGQPQIEGLLLGGSLGGLALGLVLWGHRVMEQGEFSEERERFDDSSMRERALEDLEEGGDAVARRGFLRRMLALAGAALTAAAVMPIRSLGDRSPASLYRTAWTAGSRVVTIDGEVVTVDTLQIGGFLTVFPEGHEGEADSQVALIRVSALGAMEETIDDAPAAQGFVAFSKICTHAGCPVGLYEPATASLFCPCHQSEFAVLQNARPIAGPATRPLPRLPLAVDEEGYLVATGDFPEPVGPGFWSRPR